jgi:hypothetical protein
LLLSCSGENESSDFEKFTGRWTLHIVETQADSTSNWEPRQDHYKNRQGFIIYDGIGGMGVHHVVENYEKHEFEGSGGPDTFTLNDFKYLADNFVYFGKYRVNDSLKIIEHHIESAINPRRWGTVARRNYYFNKDTLVLNPIATGYPKTRLKWVKLNDRN